MTLHNLYLRVGKKKEAAAAAKKAFEIRPQNTYAYKGFRDYGVFLDENEAAGS
ncbi:MAG: hypothetical protein ACE5G1_00290 [bacterium]